MSDDEVKAHRDKFYATPIPTDADFMAEMKRRKAEGVTSQQMMRQATSTIIIDLKKFAVAEKPQERTPAEIAEEKLREKAHNEVANANILLQMRDDIIHNVDEKNRDMTPADRAGIKELADDIVERAEEASNAMTVRELGEQLLAKKRRISR